MAFLARFLIAFCLVVLAASQSVSISASPSSPISSAAASVSPSPSSAVSSNPSPTATFVATGSPCQNFEITAPSTGLNITLFGDTNDGVTTRGLQSSCGGNAKNVWYSITPEEGAQVTISTCSSYTKINANIAVYFADALCSSPQFSQCSMNDDSCTQNLRTQSAITSFVANGNEYLIGVSSTGGDGQFGLEVEVGPAPRSNCANAIAIPGPYRTTVTVSGACELDDISTEVCRFSTESQPQWYEISPTPGIPITVSTCNLATDFDTRLAIISGTCDNLFCAYTNDDNCTMFESAASEILFTPTNSTYYVVVTGYGSRSGEFVLSITQAFHFAAGCQSAYPASVTPSSPLFTEGSTIQADVLDTVICGNEQGSAVWYNVNFSGGSGVSLVTCNTCQQTNFDTYLYVYSGICTSLECVSTNDDGCSGSSASSVSFAVTGSENFYVVVAGYGGAAGAYGLSCQYD